MPTLHWIGKDKVVNHHLDVPVRDLKALLPEFEGRVDCIYIDPPYNTGNEGWDCPFAYILASLASRSSAVDVEQIVGRVLRQPFVTRHSNPLLNMSYVFTASEKFQQTLESVVKGLNKAGFSQREYRAYGEEDVPVATGDDGPATGTGSGTQPLLFTGARKDANNAESAFVDTAVDGDPAGFELRNDPSESPREADEEIDKIVQVAGQAHSDFEKLA
ncbi:MAG TPA: restriction endonuclease, partial [Candidatus Ozemobacteraceae bacterium]|nr:restriction endonuclease [Candidatus Ozemobacteraceae bacterium]